MINRLLDGKLDKIILEKPNPINQELLDIMNSKVVGQEEAKLKLIESLHIALNDIIPKPGPIASLIFTGPSGVGKTETAFSLCEMLFGDPRAITLINCETLSDSHAGRTLFGSPPSYVGYGAKTPLSPDVLFAPYEFCKKQGMLHDSIKRFQNFAVILFDEVEKMHPKVHRELLGMLDKGIVSLGSGEQVCINNTIIIFTSNLGNQEKIETGKTKEIGFGAGTKEVKESFIDDKFKELFPPEFLSRVHGIVEFQELTDAEKKQILKNEVKHINRVLDEIYGTGILTKCNYRVINDQIKYYSSEYGVRPMIRAFKKNVLSHLGSIMNTEEMIEWTGKYNLTINIELIKGQVEFVLKRKGVTRIVEEDTKDKVVKLLPNK